MVLLKYARVNKGVLLGPAFDACGSLDVYSRVFATSRQLRCFIIVEHIVLSWGSNRLAVSGRSTDMS